jgi:hypothetical protein
MRVPAHQLVADGFCHVIECEQFLLLPDLREEHNLKKEVTHLGSKRTVIAPVDRIRHLIGFLYRVRRDARKRLFTVPWTPACRVAQLPHDLEQAVDTP